MKEKSFTIEQGSIAWKFAGSIQGTLEIDCDNKGVSNGSVAWMDCKPWKENDAGDHVKHPDKIAIIDKKSSFTYKQLGKLVDRIALGLLHIGLGKGDP
ncbi:AMP-binding protein [Peribacillus sp. NPDC058075]|uniref:AMP-binding protein n=1 Tax=unclassified Peribacillus TaxID=2675266 RepID=UPI0036DF5B11